MPNSLLNALRREAVLVLDTAREAVLVLDTARAAAFTRLPRGVPVEPTAIYSEDSWSYPANVFNKPTHDFYVKHSVKFVAPASIYLNAI